MTSAAPAQLDVTLTSAAVRTQVLRPFPTFSTRTSQVGSGKLSSSALQKNPSQGPRGSEGQGFSLSHGVQVAEVPPRGGAGATHRCHTVVYLTVFF